jgi:adenylosuccinate synthase
VANVTVLGAQWGDEGKGKIVDLLCDRVGVVARFQGGPNAGHSVVVDGQRTSLHHIPSGILHPGTICLLGNGMVIDPEGFLSEVAGLEASGVRLAGRLFVSERAHLILPHQRALDIALEDEGTLRIGTTRRGVGQAYQAKMARLGVRVVDLDDAEDLSHRLGLAVRAYAAWRPELPALPPLRLEELLTYAADVRGRLAPWVDDTGERLHCAMAAGESVLFEGSQGTLLDVDQGTYPFVTSSSTVAGGACAGAGVGPSALGSALGVFKAYATRVGEGPMPTEEAGEIGERIRTRGREFGTTTGRPRRCGWFDGVAARHAVRVNGLAGGALMLLDVLDDFDEVRLAVAYDTAEGRTDRFPASVSRLAAAHPVYETVPGWRTDITACRRWDELPSQARAFVERLEAVAGVRFLIVSVGPDRRQTIIRDRTALDALFS